MKIAGAALCDWIGHRWIPCAWKGWEQKVTIVEPVASEWECFRCRKKIGTP